MIKLKRPVFAQTLAEALGVSADDILRDLMDLNYLVIKPYYLDEELVARVCKHRAVKFQFVETSEQDARSIEQASAEQQNSYRKFIAKVEEVKRRRRNE